MDLTGGGGQAVVVQPDGKIVVGGQLSFNSGSAIFSVQRFTATGAPDPDFGVGGVVLTPVPGSLSNFGMDVGLQPDGKIILAGQRGGTDNKDQFAVLRYTTGGTLDTTFDGDGTANGSFLRPSAPPGRQLRATPLKAWWWSLTGRSCSAAGASQS